MKKILAAFVIAALALTCASAKKSIKDKIDQVKIGKFKEVDVETGNLRIKKSFTGDLYPTEFTVKVYSEDGSMGLFYKTDMAAKESLRFDKDGREALKKAYEQYLKDYEGKKLKRSKKFVQAYGVARAKMVWKMISDRAIAHPKIYFGYIFVGKSPYFCIRVVQADAEEKKGDIEVKYSGRLIYFTRAEAKTLVEAMTEEKLQEAVQSTVVVLQEEDYEDEYEEADADYEEADSGEAVKADKKAKKAKKVSEEEDPSADYAAAE